jgi:hypothetical protein
MFVGFLGNRGQKREEEHAKRGRLTYTKRCYSSLTCHNNSPHSIVPVGSPYSMQVRKGLEVSSNRYIMEPAGMSIL